MFSAFKTLTGQTVTVELKNDLAIQGTLKSVDQYVHRTYPDSSTSNWTTLPCWTRAVTRTWYVALLTTERRTLYLYPWIGGPLRAYPCRGRRHAAAGRRDTTR